jgi:hypothetical protein
MVSLGKNTGMWSICRYNLSEVDQTEYQEAILGAQQWIEGTIYLRNS